MPEVRVTTSRAVSVAEGLRVEEREGRGADRLGAGPARAGGIGRVERHREVRVGIQAPEKPLLRRDSSDQNERPAGHREPLRRREREQRRFGGAHPDQRRRVAGRRRKPGSSGRSRSYSLRKWPELRIRPALSWSWSTERPESRMAPPAQSSR